MSVYIDRAELPYGRMIMCHMVADTTKELLEMAEKIGVPAKYIQKRFSPQEHFDICLEKKAEAVRHGAIVINSRELGLLIRKKRLTPTPSAM